MTTQMVTPAVARACKVSSSCSEVVLSKPLQDSGQGTENQLGFPSTPQSSLGNNSRRWLIQENTAAAGDNFNTNADALQLTTTDVRSRIHPASNHNISHMRQRQSR